MHQIPVQLANLPIYLVCLSNGQVAFSPQQSFSLIYENIEGNVTIINNESIVVNQEHYEYNTAYNLTDELKSWLKKFELISPV